MPFLVRVTSGDDPREIAENVDDVTAHSIARNVSAATGETVELVPYVYDEKDSAWVLADEATTTIAVTANEPEPENETAVGVSLDSMKGAELDAYAAKHNVEGYKKSASVADRRETIRASLPKLEDAGSAPEPDPTPEP